MKGTLKAMKRAPHMLTSKIGMANKSTDAEFNELNRKFTGVEDYINKLIKDSTSFREAVGNLITSSSDFATAFSVVFTPLGNESTYEIQKRYPAASETMQHIGEYQTAMAELRDAVQPELDLIDSRILAPAKEYQELVKKVRKAIVKRDHKLVDFDRHNNAYSKLRDKKEKSLNDEKNLFKIEQDYEVAAEDYNLYNERLKQELPVFFQLTTQFITPLFQSFYYMQLQCFYAMLEKLQSFSEGRYPGGGSVEVDYANKLGDAAEQITSLTITKRIVSTARLMQQHRQNSTDSYSSSSLTRSGTTASSLSRSGTIPSKAVPPPTSPSYGSSTGAAPPPYQAAAATVGSAVGAGAVGKRPPPPPPPAKPKPKPAVTYVTALYDYAAQADGDLSFSAGDKIEVVQQTDSRDDWWTGRLNGAQGVFPGNYVQ